MKTNKLNRRQFVARGAGLTLGASFGGGALALGEKHAHAQGAADPRFLIVIGAAGGASLIDSVLAIRESEAATPATLNCFPDSEVLDVSDSPFRAVNISRDSVGAIPLRFTAVQSNIIQKHKDDLMVVTQTGTSVNHRIAQKRSLTGNDAFRGRTLQESVAATYGESFPLPNVNMGIDGYLEPGIDPDLPSWARAEAVADATLWPLSLHGNRGLKDLPAEAHIERARSLRNQTLDENSAFGKRFAQSSVLRRYQALREKMPGLEAQNLIERLNVFPDIPPSLPLTEYGLTPSADTAAVRSAFSKYLQDPFEAQAALAFLLLKNRASVSVTISPSFNVLLDTAAATVSNPPLAFDFSHQSHRAGQAVMWQRVLSVTDRLIDLLKSEEYENGSSFWDRTMIYIATEFGRTKQRPSNADTFGSSHDLNNGFLVFSPLANGNRMLGGVDPNTGLTYGFDPTSGVADVGRTMEEREIHAGLLHALGVDTSGSGLPDMPIMRKTA